MDLRDMLDELRGHLRLVKQADQHVVEIAAPWRA
jgi:hypothetical protein